MVLTLSGNRIYCNSICPVGTFLGILSRLSFFKIRISDTVCTQCGKCQEVCKANCIDIKKREVDFSRCVGCFNCLPICSDKAIGYLPSMYHSNQRIKIETDSRRRFFLAASATYLFSQVVSASTQEGGRSGGEYHGKKDIFFIKGPVAPPGAISVEHLRNTCIACHLCVSVCPTKVLQPSFLEYGITALNVPRMDYDINFCNYECRQCGQVCPTGAITNLAIEQKKTTQIGKVVLQLNHCIVETEGTACGSCSEHCPTQAVHMEPYKNGLTAPAINPDVCIGCGACEYACPVIDPHPAIFVMPNAIHDVAQKPKEDKVEYDNSNEFPF